MDATRNADRVVMYPAYEKTQIRAALASGDQENHDWVQ